jgi:hypothetical protein
MSWVHLSNAARNAACNAVVDLIDAGSAAGTISIYTDPQPTTANDAVPSGSTLLATLTFSDPAFEDSDSGVATASAVTSDAAADATGTATWARVSASDTSVIMDCDVGASGTTLVLNTVSIVSGATVAITAGSITMPSGA